MSHKLRSRGAGGRRRPGPKPVFARWSLLILAAFALATPLLVFGAFRAVKSNTNQVSDWLPESFDETRELAWYRKHFVGDQFVVVSWDGCEINGDATSIETLRPDPRIDKLASLLVSDKPVGGRPDALPYQHYIKSVFTGPRMLEYLVESGSQLPYELARERIVGSLLGPDRKQTCLIVTLSDESISQFREVLARPVTGPLGFKHPPGVLFQALEQCGIDVDQVHLGGPPVDNVAIDEEGERTLVRLAGFSALLGLGLSWWSLRSVRLTMIVFACGLLSATAGLAALWGSGAKTDAIVLSMPALVYVLAISGAIHLINYYRHALPIVGPAAAPGKAIAMGWKPAILCSVTTALGLLSLCTSELVPIRKFGLYSAIGVLQIAVVLFLFLPAALYYWPPKGAGQVARAKHSKRPSAAADEQADGFLARFWHWLGDWIIRHHALVTASFLLILIGFASGLQHYRTSIDLMKLFDTEARIIKDYHWLESHIGQLVPVEVVLSFSPDTIAPVGEPSSGADGGGHRWSLLERMNLVAQVQLNLERKFGERGSDVIGPSMSALTFTPPLPGNDRGLGSFVHRKLLNRKLETSYESLIGSGYVAIDEANGHELWRISLRVAAFEDVNYGEFTDALKSAVDPIVDRFADARKRSDRLNTVSASGGTSDVDAIYTGVVPIVYKAQFALLNSMVSSTVWSFLTITPLLMFVSRGIFAGLVAMIPNVLPVLVVFGGLSWLGQPIDIGSMMAASIALGVAVDDTIHFLTWYRASLNRTGDYRISIRSAYEHCATPTMQATLINGLGLSVFTISSFAPTKQFGFLMLVILVAGAVAELLLLPAILAGPMGRAFKPNPPKTL